LVVVGAVACCNQRTAGATTLAYDLANRLASTKVGTTTTSYAYYGLGRRLRAATGTTAAKTTKYLWDISGGLPQIALERDGGRRMCCWRPDAPSRLRFVVFSDNFSS
jgi:hypothetical protein